VLKRLCKLLPMSVEAQTAITLDDQAEVGLPQDLEIPPGVEAPQDAPTGTALEQLTATLRAKPEPSDAPAEAQAPTPEPDALPLEDATPPADDIPWGIEGSELPPAGKPKRRT
jgi:recombinational DNA repair protein RecT